MIHEGLAESIILDRGNPPRAKYRGSKAISEQSLDWETVLGSDELPELEVTSLQSALTGMVYEITPPQKISARVIALSVSRTWTVRLKL